MRPKQPEAEPQDDLFRAQLANLVDPRHPLVRLAGLIGAGSGRSSGRSTRTRSAVPGCRRASWSACTC